MQPQRRANNSENPRHSSMSSNPKPASELNVQLQIPPGPALAAMAQSMQANPAVLRRAGSGARKQEPGDPALPRVSVITVVLNRAHTLPDAMQSVFAQSESYGGEIEYILIDGGSTDGTVDLIQNEFSKGADSRIAAYISERDAGISDAFNRGLALATGEIIGILNSDDWYESDAIARVVAAFRVTPGAGLACGALQYWRDGQRDAIFPSRPNDLGIDMTVNHPTMFVHRTLYESLGLFKLNYKYAMDYELALRFQAAGAIFASVDDGRVLAHMRTDGAADRNWYKSLREMRLAQREIYPGRFAAAYALKYTRAVVGRLLVALGLGSVARFYRSRLSRFRRSYE